MAFGHGYRPLLGFWDFWTRISSFIRILGLLDTDIVLYIGVWVNLGFWDLGFGALGYFWLLGFGT